MKNGKNFVGRAWPESNTADRFLEFSFAFQLRLSVFQIHVDFYNPISQPRRNILRLKRYILDSIPYLTIRVLQYWFCSSHDEMNRE